MGIVRSAISGKTICEDAPRIALEATCEKMVRAGRREETI